MGLFFCTKSLCGLAAAWFPLFFSSLLLHSLVHGVPSCPRSCSCPGTKEVHCTFRHLATIPKAFPKTTERLNLGYNSLTEVEGSEFRSLRQLEMLMLHGNDISRVQPGAFYTLRSLQILKLSYNKLTSVSSGLFEGLVTLIRLHLDHNLIHFIEPYSFSGLTSLKLLQLEGNQLNQIHPHTFITISVLGSFWTSGLKHLHLADNLLEELPPAALKMAPRLELLTIHGNPWNCDCQLHWFVEWSTTHEGVVKCKKERGSAETCPQCSHPQLLNQTQLLELSVGKLVCERPVLRSPLKQWDNPLWAESEAEPDLPYTRDLEKPLGELTIVLSDSHGNRAFVSCDVRHPGDSSPIAWASNPQSPMEISVNVSLVTTLECEIDRETLQNLWQLVAYYYETPAILERGQQRVNTSKVTYQYSQAVNENSPYFTELKGYLEAEPAWLLQPRVTVKLNRQQTTTKKLVMDFTTLITKTINSHERQDDDDDVTSSWALIRRGTTGRVQTAPEGTQVHLECSVVTPDPEVKVEWMLPDLSTVEEATDKVEISERGQLVISNASVSDSGLYHCIVRSKAAVDLMPLRLTVKERSLGPTALNGQKIMLETGSSLSLPCEVTSAQPSQTLWYLPKNQVLLLTQKARRAEVMENGTLVVRKMTQEDAGEYSCLASNLYGVDMLSHMVEVTGEKDVENTKVQTDREPLILPLDNDEGEGSGDDFQETIRPFATQLPEKVGRPNNGLFKRTRMKTLKRKPNKSVKELDPNRWAEILAKVNAKPSVPLPTEQSLEEPSTVTIQASTVKTSTSSVSTTAETLLYFTTPHYTTQKRFPFQRKFKPESHSRNGKMEGVYKVPKIQQNQLLVVDPAILGSTVPSLQHVHHTPKTAQSFTTPPNLLVKQPETKQIDERRNFAPDWSNRRRPFQRRRKPPMRKLKPHKNPFYQTSNNPQGTVPQKTITTPTTTTTTTTATTTTTTTTTTPDPSTLEYSEPLPAEYEIEDNNEKYYEDYDHKSGESLEATDDVISEISPHTHLHESITPSPPDREKNHHLNQQELPNPKTLPTPKLETQILRRTEDVVYLEKSPVEKEWIKEQTEGTDSNNESNDKIFARVNERENVNTSEEQEKFTKGGERHKEKPKVEVVTQSYNSQDEFPLISRNRQRVTTRPSPDQNLPAHPKTARPTKKIEDHRPQVMEPLHPWLHQNSHERGQTSSSRTTHTDQDRNAVRHGQVNPTRHSWPPKVPPTSRWSTHHHHHQYYPMNPSRPFPHPRQGLTPTHRPWPFLHPWSHGSFVTNRPEITAETVKPTPTVSGMDPSKFLPPNFHHHNHQNHHVDSKTQTRDHLFLSRLRNRYRQAQLDRIAQLGRIATPKPQIGYKPPPPVTPKKDSPSLHRPLTLNQPAATASYFYSHEHLKPAKPSHSSFLELPPTPPGNSPTSPALHGGQINPNPTAAAPFPWLFGVNGMKPRITTVSTASVSVLAEDDVFLPCKASGNPEPNIAWTKVSTGATIPANTKHGSRFEVFRNGTFLIKNVQLQDRGQYLCTAHNRFGSDRMVITLAVQTQAPRIQLPKTSELSVYLGKTVAFDCLASGKPQAQISWILPDRTFVRDPGTIHTALSPMSLLQNGTLRIHSANFSSKGDYKCIASNAAGADTVTYQLHVAALPPSISEGVQDTVIIQPDRSMYAHCSAKGEPVPALKWTLPTGVHVKASQFLGRRVFVFPNGTLFVKNVMPSDGGRYECLASNAVGIAKRTVLLEVREDSSSLFGQGPPPPLPIPPTQSHGSPSRQHVVSALYGSAVYLHCPESTGSSRGTFWQLPSKIILEHQYSPERPIKVFHNGTLRILQLTELDGGNYQCIFQRPNGEEMELFQVEVLMTPPRIEHVRTAQTRVTFGGNFQVDCVATGLPNPEVSWSLPDGTLVNNGLQSDDSGLRNRRYVMYGNGTLLLQQMGRKDEGDYTCHATNKLGKDERKLSVKLGSNAPQIGLKSQSLVKVKLGESVKLSCQATGEPKPRITWISPHTDVIPPLSDKYRVVDDGTLILKKVTLADEGKYACVAQNSAGDDIKNMIVEAELQEPYINGVRGKTTAKLLAVSYQTALLDCRVEGKPEPKVWWLTPYGHSLTPPYLGGRFQVHQNGSLELRGVRKTDAGRYKCFAKNHLGEASLSVEMEVASLAEKPSFASPNIEILPIKQDGGELILECPARGTPIPEISWVLPNGTMLSPGRRLQRITHHFGNGTLWISQPKPSDKGIYRCLARNIAGQAEKRYSLEAGWKPVIRGTTGGMKITYGLSLNLPCTVDSWPQALITWTLPNGVVLDKPQNVGRISFLTNGTLHVRQIAPFDKGTYICRASNSFGSSTLSYPVIVMVFPPRITSTMASITRVIRGTPVMLRCAATGIPKPDISWTLPGRTTLLPHNHYTVQGGVHMTDGGNLVIQNPVLTNSGIYKCNAKNALGTDFKSTYLQVI